MTEPSGRLDLIQRAAKRLRGEEGDVIASQSTVPERGSVSAFQESVTSSTSEETRLFVKGPGTESAAAVAAVDRIPFSKSSQGNEPVQLNFAELRRRGMITPDNTTSGVFFEFRGIKRKLLANSRDKKSSTIRSNLVMVTSALPGEGKTFTATNLALALAAERDLHVLLIDSDVIHPTVGNMFIPSHDKGLTDLLNGNSADIAEVIHRCSDLPNMSVIFSGKRDVRTPELMSSRRTAEICLEISKRYEDRIVIFDTPPVLACSETANLAMHMQQIIMVVAARQTSRTQLQAALENVSACRNISLVFNKSPKWHKVEGESYYYYGDDRTRPAVEPTERR